MVTCHSSKTPEISVVVVSFNMARELPRTLHSLGAAYQVGIDRRDYEIIVVDNGSTRPPTKEHFASLDAELTIIDLGSRARPSPAFAINEGLRAARGKLIGVMIDGARIVTPGLLDASRRAAMLYERTIVTTLGFHLGHEPQSHAMQNGYDQTVEDKLLESISWPDNGYRLFEISVFAPPSANGWFLPIKESNAIFLRREEWVELGGYDERFESPGGGFVNLDTYKRAVTLPGTHLVVLLGEGSFHQIHGGIATNAAGAFSDRWRMWQEEYRRVRGHAYSDTTVRPAVFGTVPSTAIGFLEDSLRSLRR